MDKLLSFLPNDTMVKVGAVLAIVTGLLQIVGASPDWMGTTSVQGWDLVMAGWLALGFGRKFERIAKAKD